MPKPLTMPALPPGPRHEFVLNLFTHLKMANRPTLQQISDRIKAIGLPAAPSKETVRRMFRGDTVPVRWDSAYAVLLALCDLASVSPDAEHDLRTGPGTTPRDPQPSHLEHYRSLWNTALDHQPPTPTPTPTDPWAHVPPPETEPDWLEPDDPQTDPWDEIGESPYLWDHLLWLENLWYDLDDHYRWLEDLGIETKPDWLDPDDPWDNIPPPETEPAWLDPDD
jgi:hypothetical protein